MTGFEPVTCCLRNSCSTTELHRRARRDYGGFGRRFEGLPYTGAPAADRKPIKYSAIWTALSAAPLSN